eukprot:1791399-Ditylum_brightwellii.AAC.1
MDNYFTVPTVMKCLRDNGIDVVGTERARRGWPSLALQKVEQKDCDFNEFRYLIDDTSTLIGKWMDNGNSLKVDRRKPCITVKNKKHVKKVWENTHRKEICIPLLVHHYNQWMGGVDVVDQCISYYMPNHCCHRHWIPITIQILPIIRNNCYVVHLDHYGPKKNGHKWFTLTIIQDFVDRASALAEQKSPRIPATPRLHTVCPFTSSLVPSPPLNNKVTKSTSVSPKRTKLLQNSNLQLEFLNEYSHGFQEPHNLHMPSTNPTKVKGVCIYCSYLFRKNARNGNTASYNKDVKRTTKIFTYCTAIDTAKMTHFLCKDHFHCFHSTK